MRMPRVPTNRTSTSRPVITRSPSRGRGNPAARRRPARGRPGPSAASTVDGGCPRRPGRRTRSASSSGRTAESPVSRDRGPGPHSGVVAGVGRHREHALRPGGQRGRHKVGDRRPEQPLGHTVRGLVLPGHVPDVLDEPVVAERHPDLQPDGHAHAVLAVEQHRQEAGQRQIADLAATRPPRGSRPAAAAPRPAPGRTARARTPPAAARSADRARARWPGRCRPAATGSRPGRSRPRRGTRRSRRTPRRPTRRTGPRWTDRRSPGTAGTATRRGRPGRAGRGPAWPGPARPAGRACPARHRCAGNPGAPPTPARTGASRSGRLPSGTKSRALSRKSTEKVTSSPCSCSRSAAPASAATALESTPPETSVHSGTSAISWRRTVSARISRTVATVARLVIQVRARWSATSTAGSGRRPGRR